METKSTPYISGQPLTINASSQRCCDSYRYTYVYQVPGTRYAALNRLDIFRAAAVQQHKQRRTSRQGAAYTLYGLLAQQQHKGRRPLRLRYESTTLIEAGCAKIDVENSATARKHECRLTSFQIMSCACLRFGSLSSPFPCPS